MASGKLGTASLAANTNTTVYTVPANTVTTLNIALVNQGTQTATVQIALAESNSPAQADYIEHNVELPPTGVLERSALVAGAGEKLVVRTNTNGVTVRAHGFEEDI